MTEELNNKLDLVRGSLVGGAAGDALGKLLQLNLELCSCY